MQNFLRQAIMRISAKRASQTVQIFVELPRVIEKLRNESKTQKK